MTFSLEKDRGLRKRAGKESSPWLTYIFWLKEVSSNWQLRSTEVYTRDLRQGHVSNISCSASTAGPRLSILAPVCLNCSMMLPAGVRKLISAPPGAPAIMIRCWQIRLYLRANVGREIGAYCVAIMERAAMRKTNIYKPVACLPPDPYPTVWVLLGLLLSWFCLTDESFHSDVESDQVSMPELYRKFSRGFSRIQVRFLFMNIWRQ